MRVPRALRILLLFALPLVLADSGSASSLVGKVVEVFDGGAITIVSLNHPLKIKLMGIAAPEKSQPYCDVARKHLSDLVLDKYVVVRYAHLSNEGYLAGRVLLNDLDVGSQMIRDGVAWYDSSDSSDLSEQERQLYGGCEQSARLERRGLWQDATPVAPWDFRKQQLAINTIKAPSLPQPQPRARGGNQSALSNDDLFGAAIVPGTIAGQPTFRRISPDSAPGSWKRFEPENRHFSILAPGDGLEVTYPVLDSQSKIMDVGYIIGRQEGTLYLLTWAKGSNGNSTDASSASAAIAVLISGMNRAFEKSGQGFVIAAKPERELSLTGYAGKQYRLSGGPLSGVVRILSEQFGDQREMFMLCVLHGPGSDLSGDQFLNSFRISRN